MKDLLSHLEQLKADAADCARLRDLETDAAMRDLFARLVTHLDVIAAEIERILAEEAKGRPH